jgi:molecular chaperone GrpE
MSAAEKKHKPDEAMNDQPAPQATSKGNGGAAASSEVAEALPTAPAGEAAPVETLEEELRKLKLEKDELWNQVVRRQADFENYRKRVERDVAEARQLAATAVIETLLPVLDGLDRALAAPAEGAAEEYRKGFELIRKQFMETLERFGLKTIEALGKPFDPHYHHAAERVETMELPDETVLAEIQRGYTFRHKVVRPALVRVSVHPQPGREPGAAAKPATTGEPESAKPETDKLRSRLDIH